MGHPVEKFWLVLNGLNCILNKLKIPDLDEADDDGEDHQAVDDSVVHVDHENCDQVEVLLVHQSKVEDQGDGEGHQGQQSWGTTSDLKWKGLVLFENKLSNYLVWY